MNLTPFCSNCDSAPVERLCHDCLKPSNVYCSTCFDKTHRGTSIKNHTSIYLSNKTIGESKPNQEIIPDELFLTLRSILDDETETSETPNKFEFTNPNPFYGDSHLDENLYAPTFPKFDHTIPAYSVRNPSGKSFFGCDPSLSIEEPCFLFESGTIRKFNSVESLAHALSLEIPIENFKVPIITFIGKRINVEPLPNLLLLKDNYIKFPSWETGSKSPICIMIYDKEAQLLILDAQNMYKLNERCVDSQIVLLNVLLALSDVIIFSESGTSERGRDKAEFIRMHEMMKTCKNRFGTQFSKINKMNPDSLAPALIYLKLTKSFYTDNLSTLIKNATGRDELFTSFTKIVFFNPEEQNNMVFIEELRTILKYLSEYRSLHSLSDIWQCIENCINSVNFIKEDISSNDIPNNWFFCNKKCELCQAPCKNSFGHVNFHFNSDDCSPLAENEVYYCKKCFLNSNGTHYEPLVLKPMSEEESFLKNIVSYPIRRGIIECKEHGIIFDKNFLVTFYEDTVILKHVHKWPGENLLSQNVYPVGQRLIDKVKEISEPATEFLIKSTELISDAVKPEDWQSTRESSHCSCCKESFTIKMSKHHCRNCKLVICSMCYDPQSYSKICKICEQSYSNTICDKEPPGITILNLFRDAWKIPGFYIKKTVSYFNKPDYWECDEKAIRCFNCGMDFHSETNVIHHCRACGKCVCDKCSQERRPIEWRCIYVDSRVCDKCIENHFWKNGR